MIENSIDTSHRPVTPRINHNPKMPSTAEADNKFAQKVADAEKQQLEDDLADAMHENLGTLLTDTKAYSGAFEAELRKAGTRPNDTIQAMLASNDARIEALTHIENTLREQVMVGMQRIQAAQLTRLSIQAQSETLINGRNNELDINKVMNIGTDADFEEPNPEGYEEARLAT